MKIKKAQIIRHIVQIISLIIYPGLFILTLNSIGSLYKMILANNASSSAIMSSLIVIIAVIPITIILGRVFCSYVCAFGTIQELFNKLGNLFHIKKIKINRKVDSFLKWMKYAILIAIVILWTINIDISEYSPWNSFGIITSFSNYSSLISIGGLLLLIIIILSLFIDRFFCRYLCPLGGIFSIVSKLRIFKIKRNSTCISCDKCNKNCPMNIDVSDKSNDVIKSGECIDCYECVDNCPNDSLHTSVNKTVIAVIASVIILGLTFMGNVLSENDVFDFASNEVTSESSNTTEDSSSNGIYKDGTYTGSANGYRGETKVSVVVKNGNITSITIDSYEDDKEFFNKADDTIIDEIIDSQSVDVDIVTGATFSSRGIINAVANALGVESSTVEIPENTQVEMNHHKRR